MKYPEVNNFINGEITSSRNGTLDVYSPLDGSIISKVTISSSLELDKAVIAARNAFKSCLKLLSKKERKFFSNIEIY